MACGELDADDVFVEVVREVVTVDSARPKVLEIIC